MGWLKQMLLAAAIAAWPASLLHADTLWIGENNAKAIKADGVKITSIKDDRLYYTTDGGMQASKPLNLLPQINIDGETNFNNAENAFARDDLDTAINSYQQVLQSGSAKDWMLSRSCERLIKAAKQKNRFDAQVSAYCSLLAKDPTVAAANKPTTPDEHTANLDAALTTVSKSLESAQPAQKPALLSLELEIDRAKGDKAQTSATLQQLVALGGATPAEMALLKVESAKVDLDAREFDKAITTIETNRALFTEPDQQIDALYVLAQAHMGLDGNKTDPDKLKDLALNYLRVVAFGNKLPDRPHVADSLVAAAEIETKIGDTTAAQHLYEQVVKDKTFLKTPAYDKAASALSGGTAPFGLPKK